ncbi:hypothetical protein C8R30_12210 [Nitrosomonas nitrosa]|jgi:hypothetical protein|uniref:Uncharacterized protein n=1 Tax=Nitrosomonas nitrosa TaxID=52442 RepID=A0A1I4UP56_9PROT|nr:hypothetical protein C8R30_12210 [Nitrosomonas nitrosa]SFM90711.1 hypothetical protein SAMN05421880_1503 [Nitrosomonas nitrosa]
MIDGNFVFRTKVTGMKLRLQQKFPENLKESDHENDRG